MTSKDKGRSRPQREDFMMVHALIQMRSVHTVPSEVMRTAAKTVWSQSYGVPSGFQVSLEQDTAIQTEH